MFESDVIATSEDPNATIKKSGNINLSTTNSNEYVVTVTAPDGFTKQSYKIYITREKGSNALLNNLVVKKGKLETVFQSNVLEYNWLVQKDSVLTKEDVIATAQDVNATITKTESITVTVDNNQDYIVRVVSEDGSTTTEYILHPVIDEASDNTRLVSLTPSVGTIEYSNDVTEYEIEVEPDVTEISFEAVPEDTKAVVEGTELKTLENGENIIIIRVTAEDEVTTRTITIKVKRGKAIEEIIPSESKILLDISEEKTITYTLVPEDTTMREVEWISDNESIATVDENGVIKGIGYGTTKVTLQSKDNPEVKTEIEVVVLRKKITSSIYQVEHEVEVAYTTGAESQDTVSAFKKNFENEESTLYVYDKEGNLVEDEETTIITTFMKMKLIIEGEEYDEVTVVLKGDLDGDGYVTMSDFSKFRRSMLMIIELNYIERRAADVVGDDDIISMSDFSKLKRYMLKIIDTLN